MHGSPCKEHMLKKDLMDIINSKNISMMLMGFKHLPSKMDTQYFHSSLLM